jgi:hypothetical protein
VIALIQAARVPLHPKCITGPVRLQIAEMVQSGLPRDEICRQTGVRRKGLDRMLDAVSYQSSVVPRQL